MLKWESKLKSRLNNLKIFDRQILDTVKVLYGLKVFNGPKVLIGLEVLDVND